MATTIKLEGEARSEFGKGVARRLRVANKIPATIYAGGEEPPRDLADARDHPGPASHQRPCSPLAFDGNTKMPSSGRAEEPVPKRIIEHVTP